LPEDDDGELLDGRLVEEETPDYVHEVIVGWLLRTFGAWVAPLGGLAGGAGGGSPARSGPEGRGGCGVRRALVLGHRGGRGEPRNPRARPRRALHTCLLRRRWRAPRDTRVSGAGARSRRALVRGRSAGTRGAELTRFGVLAAGARSERACVIVAAGEIAS